MIEPDAIWFRNNQAHSDIFKYITVVSRRQSGSSASVRCRYLDYVVSISRFLRKSADETLRTFMRQCENLLTLPRHTHRKRPCDPLRNQNMKTLIYKQILTLKKKICNCPFMTMKSRHYSISQGLIPWMITGNTWRALSCVEISRGAGQIWTRATFFVS